MSDGIVKNFATPKDFYSIRFQGGGGGTFLTITKDGQIVAGEGLSQDEATQAAAKMLAEQFSALHQKQAARIAELEAVIDPVVLQAAEGFPVEEAIQKVVEGSLLTDQQKIEVYLAYKYRWIKAFFAGGRRKGMEEAALRLEELHQNHKYNPQNGEGSEHDTGYYRAISEGVAHIRAAAKEENRPSEEIIREDRDAWPDHQANDPIRAAANEVK